MPGPNVNVAIGTVGVVVISVAAAAAIAIYESPEVRQFAEDCRRKIAVALHSLGDEINPASRQPRFNRPEDAEGFLQSGAEAGLDGDEESRRKQREELMYWNQVRLEKQERDARKLREQGTENNTQRSGAIYNDSMHGDQSAEQGTIIYNSGANVNGNTDEGLTQRRGQGLRGLDRGNFYANPFADEHHIEMEDVQCATDAGLMSPEPSEMSEDIYGLEPNTPATTTTRMVGEQQPEPSLIDVESHSSAEVIPVWNSEMHTSGYEAHPDAFASIQAWADNSQSQDASFYSPLPVASELARSETSEPVHVSGDLTPTDSVSVVDPSETAHRDASASSEDRSRYYDVESDVSDDEAGVSTPGSWTEVGSVVSEMEAAH